MLSDMPQQKQQKGTTLTFGRVTGREQSTPTPPLVAACLVRVLRRGEARDAEQGGGLSSVEYDCGLLQTAVPQFLPLSQGFELCR